MSQGYRFAGTQASNWCFCGDKYDTLGLATNCDNKCKGNPDQICGGLWANSVYEVPASELNLPFSVGDGSFRYSLPCSIADTPLHYNSTSAMH